MIKVAIINWLNLVDTFGDKKALDLFHKLRAGVSAAKTEEEMMNIAVDFDSEKSEAIALFTLDKKTKVYPSKEVTLRYTYTGTAN